MTVLAMAGTVAPAAGGGGSFSPADLFTSGEAGFWLDPSDLSTMFTDAGTTNVTSDGQLVYRIEDKSGNALVFDQTTSASRPKYKTDGTYHWLEFDGSDDEIFTSSAIGISGSANRELLTAISGELAFCHGRGLVDFGDNGTRFSFVEDSGGNFRVEIQGNASVASTAVPASGEYIAGVRLDGTTLGDLTGRLDGSDFAFSGSATINTSDGDGFGIGDVNGSGSVYTAMNLYGLIVIDRLLTSSERADLDSWLAGKAGVTL